MKFATVLAVAAAACVVSGSPLRKRQLSNSGNNDITILNFALLLETLEFEFYNTGLKKFGEADFRRANIPNPTQAILNFHHILQHEAKHVETLKAVIKSLGGEAIPKCEFEFPMDSVQTFTKLASVLEKTGVAAYNGAVNLLKNPDLQTAAANIDTVEARHASFLQTVNGLDPFPADFDVALDGRQVVTLAAPVIKACPFELPFAPFGALKVDESEVLLPGGECKVKFKREGEQQHFCNFVFSDQSLVSELSSDNKCEIPDEARGDVFLMITSSEKGVTLKDTNAVVAGPVVLNVDTAHDDSCQRFVGKDGENTVDSLEVPHQMPKHEMP
ncbi:MAG: ferritin-like domain-containing protein, partial [Olpidium bornovanus]